MDAAILPSIVLTLTIALPPVFLAAFLRPRKRFHASRRLLVHAWLHYINDAMVSFRGTAGNVPRKHKLDLSGQASYLSIWLHNFSPLVLSTKTFILLGRHLTAQFVSLINVMR